MKPKLCFYDHGLFTSFARKLSEGFEVFYYTPEDVGAFPSPNGHFVGEGFDEITRIKDFWKHQKEMDYFFFADIYAGGLQQHLRELGCKVFGSGRGDALEILRWKMRKLMAMADMPLAKAERVIGLPALREYLKSHEDVFVKVSGYRGACETFCSKSYALIEPRLDELENDLGGLKYLLPFIVEEKIDAVVESGYDGFSIDGQFPDKTLFGVEVKDCGYLGTFADYANMPDGLRFVNDKLAPMLKAMQYRMAISTEVRFTEDQIPYLIDLTCRLPSPPNELMSEIYTNLPEIVMEGSEGRVVTPTSDFKFGVSATVYASLAEDHWSSIYTKPSVAQFVKLHNNCMIDGVEYIIPSNIKMGEAGQVIGLGDTLEDAAKHCRENAAGIEGYSVEIKLDSLSEGLGEIKKMQNCGMKFCDEKLPEKL